MTTSDFKVITRELVHHTAELTRGGNVHTYQEILSAGGRRFRITIWLRPGDCVVEVWGHRDSKWSHVHALSGDARRVHFAELNTRAEFPVADLAEYRDELLRIACEVVLERPPDPSWYLSGKETP